MAKIIEVCGRDDHNVVSSICAANNAILVSLKRGTGNLMIANIQLRGNLYCIPYETIFDLIQEVKARNEKLNKIKGMSKHDLL